jgi:hypothetical protein
MFYEMLFLAAILSGIYFVVLKAYHWMKEAFSFLFAKRKVIVEKIDPVLANANHSSDAEDETDPKTEVEDFTVKMNASNDIDFGSENSIENLDVIDRAYKKVIVFDGSKAWTLPPSDEIHEMRDIEMPEVIDYSLYDEPVKYSESRWQNVIDSRLVRALKRSLDQEATNAFGVSLTN